MPKGERRYCALVVDDQRDAAETFAQLLAAMGFEAAFTTDPREALKQALALQPQIAFLDIGMPHVNGYEVARQLRAHFPADRLVLVAVTAYADAEHRIESRRAGFDAHVTKPLDPALLDSILETLVARK